jgi:hypothetical protein
MIQNEVRTSGPEISLADVVTDALEPASLETVESTLTIDEFLPAHVDGPIAVA